MIWFWGITYCIALALIIAFFMGASERRRMCSRCGVPPREGLFWCIDCLKELADGASERR